MQSLVIFASGAGTNAKAIIDYFRQNGKAQVSMIVCNKPGAGVLKIAEDENIPVYLVNRQNFREESFIEAIKEHNPSLIVLAGFLWKIPDSLIAAFRDKIINIHPALLPKFGGKGMYGNFVHEGVIAVGEKESGITIHYVDEVYDSGDIILQARCKVAAGDTPQTLAGKIHKLEHFFFPRCIEYLLQ